MYLNMDPLDPAVLHLLEDDTDVLEMLSDSDSDQEDDAQWKLMVQTAAKALVIPFYEWVTIAHSS